MAKTANGIKKMSMKKLQTVLSKFEKPMQLLDQIVYNINKSVIPTANYKLIGYGEKPAKLSMIDEDNNPLAFVKQCATVYEAQLAICSSDEDFYIVQTLKVDNFTINDSHQVSYNLKFDVVTSPFSFVGAALVSKEDESKPAFLTITHNDEMIITVFP